MKRIKYLILGLTKVYNPETETIEEKENHFEVDYPATDETMSNAKENAINGEITEYDDGVGEESPTQLDIIEAQVTYTAMMTDTLLEV